MPNITDTFDFGNYVEQVFKQETMWFAPADQYKCLRKAGRCKEKLTSLWYLFNLGFPNFEEADWLGKPIKPIKILESFSIHGFEYKKDLLNTTRIAICRRDLDLSQHKDNIHKIIHYLNSVLQTQLTVIFENDKAVIKLCSRSKTWQPAVVSFFALCLRISPFFSGTSVVEWMKTVKDKRVNPLDLEQLGKGLETIKLIEAKKLRYCWSIWPPFKKLKEMTDYQTKGLVQCQQNQSAFFGPQPFTGSLLPRCPHGEFFFSYSDGWSTTDKIYSKCKSYIQDRLSEKQTDKTIGRDYYLLAYKEDMYKYQNKLELMFESKDLPFKIKPNIVHNFLSIKVPKKVKKTPFLVSFLSGLVRVSPLWDHDKSISNFLERLPTIKDEDLTRLEEVEKKYLIDSKKFIDLILKGEAPSESWKEVRKYGGPHVAGYFSTAKRLKLINV